MLLNHIKLKDLKEYLGSNCHQLPKCWVLQRTPRTSGREGWVSSDLFDRLRNGVSMGIPDWNRSQIRARNTSAQDLLFFAPNPGLLAAC